MIAVSGDPSHRRVGEHIRCWRQRRRLSQLDLATDADVSARHLSFVETGRSQPSREMLLHLARQMNIPSRECNVLLVAAGYAPIYVERPLSDPVLGPARNAIEAVLERQRPYPAYAFDRYWNVVASNGALPFLYEGCAPDLLQHPMNAARLSLHPDGLAKRIENLPEWHAHFVQRLSSQANLTADPALLQLLEEVKSYAPSGPAMVFDKGALLPLRLRTSAGLTSFFIINMSFDAPIDITLTELTLQCFFPADPGTQEIVQCASLI
jgi:transcriptional regulator with XRE-family HTH domain